MNVKEIFDSFDATRSRCHAVLNECYNNERKDLVQLLYDHGLNGTVVQVRSKTKGILKVEKNPYQDYQNVIRFYPLKKNGLANRESLVVIFPAYYTGRIEEDFIPYEE